MQLVGMLDSPYVRRVAISLHLLGLHFEHKPLSVFKDVDEFRRLNAVVRAPTLICEDGTVLMDSTLILEYAEALARPGRSLLPSTLSELRRTLHVIGLALAACEKNVALLYERDHRPAAKSHAPWVARVTGQVLAAYRALETELRRAPLACDSTIDQAGISVAVAWKFTQMTLPDIERDNDFSALARFSACAEDLPAFRAAPYSADGCHA